MSNILILGASGKIARHVVEALAGQSAHRVTLFLRNAAKLAGLDTSGMTVIEGDVTDEQRLTEAMQGQDIVYANLTGEVDGMARTILPAMQASGVKRLIFVTSIGILDEVPGAFGEWNRQAIGPYLPPFRRASDMIEASDLDYTVIRPAWLTDNDEVDFGTTTRDEPFTNTEVSRKSVAAYVLSLLDDPSRDIGGNIGVHKPGTEGDKPAFV